MLPEFSKKVGYSSYEQLDDIDDSHPLVPTVIHYAMTPDIKSKLKQN